MRIWTRKSASIQPRTSLRKSAVSWPDVHGHDDAAALDMPLAPRGLRGLRGGRRRGRGPTMLCQNFVRILSEFSPSISTWTLGRGLSSCVFGDLLCTQVELLCISAWTKGFAVGGELDAEPVTRPRHNHSFGGSFSAGSKPIFASKYAFLNHFSKSTRISSSREQTLQIS